MKVLRLPNERERKRIIKNLEALNFQCRFNQFSQVLEARRNFKSKSVHVEIKKRKFGGYDLTLHIDKVLTTLPPFQHRRIRNEGEEEEWIRKIIENP